MSEVDWNGPGRGINVMKSQRSSVAAVTTSFATSTFLLNQRLPPFAAALLLGYVILVSIVCDSVLASA
jgi:hypothetical protein